MADSVKQTLIAGASEVDITPDKSMFLFGYPHVQRMSTGVHDPLLSSALYLHNGSSGILFIAHDLIWVPRDVSERARQRIVQEVPVTATEIMITASHTHSGPITVSVLSNEADPVVPKPDLSYLQMLEDKIVEAAVLAYRNAKPAEVGLACVDGSMVGTNRRSPEDMSIPQTPVMAVRDVESGSLVSLMVIASMHPTVLHEDSTLISGDWPGLMRRYLQEEVVGASCPIVYHMGASGNQSPRHVTQSNTFAEAERLGIALGKAVEEALPGMNYLNEVDLKSKSTAIEIPLRRFPSIEDAKRAFDAAQAKFTNLQASNAPATEVRTAECDVFGAEETWTLAKAAQAGRLQEVAQSYLPMEVQVVQVSDWRFLGWSGEVFVEFALQIMANHPDTFIITLVNGDMQGYIVTEQAVAEGGYEASNALFESPASGNLLVKASEQLLTNL